MANDPEINSPMQYRAARKAFIAACEKARADPISRVHPKLPGPDGKPLFIDSTALGPRNAKRAVLVIANGAAASAAMTALLRDGMVLPDGARLVLVHAIDPFSFAGVRENDPQWSLAMLRAVATEDLGQAADLTVLAVDMPTEELEDVFMSQKPGRKLALKQIGAKTGTISLRPALEAEFRRF